MGIKMEKFTSYDDVHQNMWQEQVRDSIAEDEDKTMIPVLADAKPYAVQHSS